MTTNRRRKNDAHDLAASDGIPYTAALRQQQADNPRPAPATPPETTGGHDFGYEHTSDLFRCRYCKQYQISVTEGGSLTPCTGPTGYAGDTERVYVMVVQDPAVPDLDNYLVRKIGETGIGRLPQFSWRPPRLLIESAPSVVEELIRQIRVMSHPVRGGRPTCPARSITQLTAAEGRAVLAENYAAYVAEFGEPRQ